MKKVLIFSILLTKCSFVLTMAPDPVAHIKRQIAQLKAEGLDDAQIALVATNTLQGLLQHHLLHFPLERYISQFKALVEAGADKNVRHPTNGKNALMFAALDSRPDIFRELLALGLDTKTLDSNGCNASQQYPVINDASIPEIQCLFEEAELAQQTQKLKISK